ncbi:MAG: class E sortase [Actinomycetes bacterium]
MIRALVRGLGELLITAGLLLLLFVAWQLWWTDVQAGRESGSITADLRGTWSDGDAPAPAGSGSRPEAGEPPSVTPPAEGESFGLVHVPRFGDDYVVPLTEGIGLEDVLNKGVLGHYPGTAGPGAVGNFSVAGHRVTYGRPLHLIAELRPGDPIVVETEDAWYVYRVREAQIVTPDRVDVVAPVPNEPDAEPTERLMTLTACHPMYSARERYIVHAVLDTWQPRDAGEPDALAAG